MTSVCGVVGAPALSGLGGGSGREGRDEICVEARDRLLAVSVAGAARPAFCLIAGSVCGAAIAAVRESSGR